MEAWLNGLSHEPVAGFYARCFVACVMLGRASLALVLWSQRPRLSGPAAVLSSLAAAPECWSASLSGMLFGHLKFQTLYLAKAILSDYYFSLQKVLTAGSPWVLELCVIHRN